MERTLVARNLATRTAESGAKALIHGGEFVLEGGVMAASLYALARGNTPYDVPFAYAAGVSGAFVGGKIAHALNYVSNAAVNAAVKFARRTADLALKAAVAVGSFYMLVKGNTPYDVPLVGAMGISTVLFGGEVVHFFHDKVSTPVTGKVRGALTAMANLTDLAYKGAIYASALYMSVLPRYTSHEATIVEVAGATGIAFGVKGYTAVVKPLLRK